MERISKTVLHLIIINAVLLLITELNLIPNINLTRLLALHYFENTHFGWWQYVSYMFMHGDFMHLFFNMYALWAFGTPLENIWGRNKFLFFYFSCGVGAALLHTMVNYYYVHQGLEALQNVGVSTEEVIRAVAFAMFFPDAKLMLFFVPYPIAARYFIPIIVALDLFSGFTGFSLFGGNIAHFAHVGGALIGFLIMLYWKKHSFDKNRWDRFR